MFGEDINISVGGGGGGEEAQDQVRPFQKEGTEEDDTPGRPGVTYDEVTVKVTEAAIL